MSHPHRSATLLSVAALVAGMISLCIGTSYGKRLFPLVGAEGTAAMRVCLAALILNLVWRPWRAARHPGARDRLVVLGYGAALGMMNLAFYCALATVPLGVAVALEFTGPLAVALAASRSAADLLWTALAVAGLMLLLPAGPLHAALHGVDPRGAALALVAGFCWALYILLGQRASRAYGGRATAIGMAAAAVVVLPAGLARGGARLFDPAIALPALAVALLSSVIPYSLEMTALRHLTRRSFGTLMSLEPAVAAIAGLLILGERLSLLQGAAIACVIVASAGSLRARPAPPQIVTSPE